jgi:saccharopine dehydrogenase (NAD+, L-lysine-forming)
MKVLQLGVGSVGEVTARVVAAEPAVDTVVLADLDETRSREVGGLIGPKAMPVVLDANDSGALEHALAGADLVINALIPRFNLAVMEACLETGTHYLDMAAGGPRDIVGTADVDEELALHERFREKGLSALVFFGIDPGASDVFARHLYEGMDTVESLTVLDGDNGVVAGFDVACGFSPDTMIEECLLPPTSYVDGRLVRHEPLTRSVEFDFPKVGRLRAWNVDHEESQLMPLHLDGKGLRRADFFIALDPGFVELLRSLRKLGLDSPVPLEFKGAWFSPREFVLSRLPRPVDLKGRIAGAVCVGTLAVGTKGGQRVARFAYNVTAHEDAFARMGVQGTGYQTGVPAAAAAALLAQGRIVERGVLAPERLDPDVFLAEMTRLGCPWGVVDFDLATVEPLLAVL